MPYIIGVFYSKHIKNKIYLENIKLNALAKKVQVETKVLRAEEDKEKTKLRIKNTAPEILWKEEYEEFKKNILYPKFQDIIDHYYQYNAQIEYKPNEPWASNQFLHQEILVFADINELIIINGNKFDVTKKGREFIKLYVNDKKNINLIN